jgi:hypothetical protein
LYEIPSKFYPNVSDNLIIKNEVIWSLIFIIIYCIICCINMKWNNTVISMPEKPTL